MTGSQGKGGKGAPKGKPAGGFAHTLLDLISCCCGCYGSAVPVDLAVNMVPLNSLVEGFDITNSLYDLKRENRFLSCML